MEHICWGAGEDLCDCEFSLAYGGRILLSNATLRLKVGSRYGLCGPNGAGKTTLMKAIANGQVHIPTRPLSLGTVNDLLPLVSFIQNPTNHLFIRSHCHHILMHCIILRCI